MAQALISPPAATAISLSEVKQHLRIETNDDDEYLNELISAATSHLEAIIEMKLITQTWRSYFDKAPADGYFALKTGPVQTALDMRIYSHEGEMLQITAQELELDTVSKPARLFVSFPFHPLKKFNGIEIDLVLGFGDAPLDVPHGLRRALLLLVAHNYEFRGAVSMDQQPAHEPQGFRTLIAPFKSVRL